MRTHIAKDGYHDATLAEWLMEFKKETTQRTYLYALRNFKAKLGIADLGDYVKGAPNVSSDVKKFLASLDGKPSKTVSTYVGAVKVFLQDHGIKVPDEEWTKIKRRGFMPKRVKAARAHSSKSETSSYTYHK